MSRLRRRRTIREILTGRPAARPVSMASPPPLSHGGSSIANDPLVSALYWTQTIEDRSTPSPTHTSEAYVDTYHDSHHTSSSYDSGSHDHGSYDCSSSDSGGSYDSGSSDSGGGGDCGSSSD